MSADGHKLVYRAAGGGGGRGGRGRGRSRPARPRPALFLVDADRQARRKPAPAGSTSPLRMYLDPKEEFKQIFYEGWRNQRDYLYVPNMHGADWPQMKEMYGQLLPYVNHRADLNYLLDMMGSEIAIGHSFVRGGDMPRACPARPAACWARISRSTGTATKSRAFTTTKAGIPSLRAPLAEPGVDVATGDYILAINGEELRAPDNIYRLLDGTANRQTVLTVNSRPVMEGARQVTVVPVANEQGLRTRAWVEANRRLVDKLSGRPTGLRLHPQHRPARLCQLQSLLLRAAG